MYGKCILAWSPISRASHVSMARGMEGNKTCLLCLLMMTCQMQYNGQASSGGKSGGKLKARQRIRNFVLQRVQCECREARDHGRQHVGLPSRMCTFGGQGDSGSESTWWDKPLTSEEPPLPFGGKLTLTHMLLARLAAHTHLTKGQMVVVSGPTLQCTPDLTSME